MLATFDFLFEQKQRSQHDQGYVMMPGIPAAHLIVGQAAFALGLAEAVLDEVALRACKRKIRVERFAGLEEGESDMEDALTRKPNILGLEQGNAIGIGRSMRLDLTLMNFGQRSGYAQPKLTSHYLELHP